MSLTINWYLISGIAIIVILLIAFFVSYVVNAKTPVPKGCEDLLKDDEKCQACNNFACHYHKKEREED